MRRRQMMRSKKLRAMDYPSCIRPIDGRVDPCSRNFHSRCKACNCHYA